jgi:hypothetical protein
MNNNLFLLNPSHARFLDGSQRKLMGVNRVQLALIGLVCIITAAVGIGMAAYSISEQTVQEQLASTGILTIADVVDQRYSRGRSTTYYVTYSYEVESGDGQFETFTHEENVSSGLYDRTSIGGHVSIRYLPDDPATARVVDQAFPGWVLLLIGTAFIIGMGYLLLSQIRLYLRDRILEREGQVVNGSIVKSWFVGRGNKRQVYIQYTFNSPYGAELKGKQGERRGDLTKEQLPQEGTKIAVLYHNDSTFRAL